MSDFNNYIQDLQDKIKHGGERSHYSSLERLIEGLIIGVNVIVEEKGNQAGIPDLTIRKNDRVVGYIEAKDVNVDISKLDKSEQIKRYLESNIGYNFILTNYLDFRWYVDGECEKIAKLANIKDNEISLVDDLQPITELLQSFINQKAKDINNYYDLAKAMATYTKTIRNAIASSLIIETTTDELKELKELKEPFKKLLLLDIDNASFADMYAQTIAYGLFTAKINHANNHAQNPGDFVFNRTNASIYITERIPFLKGFFDIVINANGANSVSKIHKSIENLIELFNTIDMTNILENFGRETRTEDPVLHFYETFLAAYQASLRKSRGVYYTPEPVVNFIVRAVNDILTDRNIFDLEYGLGNRRVTILDPATGTGTFLYAVIKQMRDNVAKYGVDRWNLWLKDAEVLNRLFGFELLMTAYTIAHLKLGLLLADFKYEFAPDERLKIYLTNALEEGIKQGDLIPGITQIIAEESSQAANVKTEIPIMVVLGNPPYSVSSQNASKRKRILNQDEKYLADVEYTGLVWNKVLKNGKAGKTITELTHIGELLELYKGRVRLEGEKNIQPLDDDYIKFIRFAQYQIQKTPQGYGIIGFITNHSYINGLIHRGMREELLKYFDTLYIMDLHGNSLLKETSPDGGVDENVFDIQQGVAILIAVREKSAPDYFSTAYKSRDGVKELAQVFYYDLWGCREEKYNFLESTSLDNVNWIEVKPTAPNYFFAPKNFDLATEYNQGWSVTDIFPVNSTGVKTHRDHFVIDFDLQQLRKRIEDFRNLDITDDKLVNIYDLRDTRDWKISIKRKLLSSNLDWMNYFTTCFYRPFDTRFYYHHQDVVELTRNEIMQNVNKLNNIGLILCRQQSQSGEWSLVSVSDQIIECCAISNKTRETNYLFLLYTYPNTDNDQTNLFVEKTPNLSTQFLEAIKNKLGKTPTPEQIFYYAYAIFHSPTYRSRYAEFLKIDFPRLPLTSNQNLFNALANKGEALVNLHLMKSDLLNNLITTYQEIGDHQITEVTYNSELQRVYINKQNYFTDIPQHIWEVKIGGYQVLDKWLKDRKNAKRKLSNDEIIHYQKIVVVLTETLRIMEDIDQIIPGFPIE
ncbi:N-6 DNA methylase [Sphaerospermopsis kisseleviana CS-549]|uniref:site-specific DNA-methyltransferase (adenine-specific) n=1 Tax=Sphaerospermopsis kisseleviana CS-549 TaxID=3021783 RepID=A0ABT4ZMJ9_9CYAN|nr:type ISP restriction/modification enzyme [Sphaerospermopsis kisseleviana]MDB9440607.1 N-6 DNA methylase [Sphaerospermopsis kisseleviana CS-549]BAZ83146.1 adenine specific DNA methyltransferase [Sphaerospermopsis kisseleviana NIES-73]